MADYMIFPILSQIRELIKIIYNNKDARTMPLLKKRIPVTEDTWQALGELKEPHQTYDELLQDMIDAFHARRLTQDITGARERAKYKNLEFRCSKF